MAGLRSRSRLRVFAALAAHAAVVAGVGAGVACGAANFEVGAYGAGDSGTIVALDGAPAAGDGGAPFGSDGGASSDGGPTFPVDSGASFAPVPVLAVHASANLYDFRLCFGVLAGGTTSILPVPAYPDDPSRPVPETNYPGVAVGSAAMLPALSVVGTQVTPYVVRAQLLDKFGYLSTSTTEPTCDQLICTGGSSCLTAQLDYFALPPVQVPVSEQPIVLAVVGCGPSLLGSASVAQCGAGYTTSNGNLSALVAQVAFPSSAAGDGGSWTVQVANLSPSFTSDDGGPPALTYADPTTDASVVLSAATAGSIGVLATSVPLSDAGVTAAYFGLGPSPSSPASLTQSLVSIQYFQAPSSDPYTYFTAPVTYFTAIVGDATDAAAPASLPDGAANPAFDGHGLHVLAYPTSAVP